MAGKSRKKPVTPISQIKGCFRMLQMRAREIHAYRKAHQNTCEDCGKKHSVAKDREVKVQVHHTKAIDWQRICAVVREEILDPANFRLLCTDCHDKEHAELGTGWKEHSGKAKERYDDKCTSVSRDDVAG